MSNFEVITQCHNFTKRILWHLESLKRNNVTANVAVCDHEHRDYILAHYPNTRILMVPKRIFGQRGYCRNRQVKNLHKDTDFAIFADCDQVYDIQYFQELDILCSREDLENKKAVVGVSRESWPELFASDIIDAFNWQNLPNIVKGIKEASGVLPEGLMTTTADSVRYSTRNVCAGYFQMIHRKFLNGKYIHGETRDGCTFKNKGTKMKSDMQFRREIGTVLKWKTQLNQYHLNHRRDISEAR